MAQTPQNSVIGLAYSHIVGPATTVVKPVPGALMKLIINSGSAGTVTVYDGTSAAGAVIGVITLGAAVALPTPWFSGEEAISFKVGLTVVTSAACDVTVLYR